MSQYAYSELIGLMKRAVNPDRLAARAFSVRESDKWCSAENFEHTMRELADEARQLGLTSVEIVHGVPGLPRRRPGEPGRGQGSGAWTQWEHWTVRGAILK